MPNEIECIHEELRRRMTEGCTCLEIVRAIEGMLGEDVTASTVSSLFSNAFEVHAGYATHSQISLRDAAVLNGSLLPKIVANRAEWQTSNPNRRNWMDEVKVQQPPEEDEDVIPFGVSAEGWQALPDADKERLLTAKRSLQWAFYCKSVMATLCEQLQQKVSTFSENE